MDRSIISLLYIIDMSVLSDFKGLIKFNRVMIYTYTVFIPQISAVGRQLPEGFQTDVIWAMSRMSHNPMVMI